MFVVFNKEKINAYLISVGTVTLLLVMGFFIASKDTIPTMANEQEIISNIELKTKEKINIIKNNEIHNAQNIINMN